MQTIQTKLLVLGGGPGGYVAAIRAGQLGISTTLIEHEALGGTCLNVGCIPSKALIHVANQFSAAQAMSSPYTPMGIRVQNPRIDVQQMVAWKDGIVERLTGGISGLLKRQKVQVVRGWGSILDGKTVEVRDADGDVTHRVHCEHLLLANGSVPVELPVLPFDGHTVISSTEALSPRSLPKELIVVGAGYIGLELGITYRKLGVQVSVVEAADRVLPNMDADLSRPVHARLERLGVQLHLNHQVVGPITANDRIIGVEVRTGGAGSHTVSLKADQILVAVGRKPRTEGFNLESLHLGMKGRGIEVDDQCRTSMRHVWAIGDLTEGLMLAHRAMAQGEMVAEIIAGNRRHFRPAAIPSVCFTDPEVVSVGMLPAEAAAAGHDVIQGQFPFMANSRAMTLEDTEGFVRVVARRDNHRILGWQAVGAHVAELATPFAQSLEMGAHLEDVAYTIHGHPSLGEAVQEAALRALGHAIHV